jgi:hypothetical protein
MPSHTQPLSAILLEKPLNDLDISSNQALPLFGSAMVSVSNFKGVQKTTLF